VPANSYPVASTPLRPTVKLKSELLPSPAPQSRMTARIRALAQGYRRNIDFVVEYLATHQMIIVRPFHEPWMCLVSVECPDDFLLQQIPSPSGSPEVDPTRLRVDHRLGERVVVTHRRTGHSFTFTTHRKTTRYLFLAPRRFSICRIPFTENLPENSKGAKP
jgi:hypothetical protein